MMKGKKFSRLIITFVFIIITAMTFTLGNRGDFVDALESSFQYDSEKITEPQKILKNQAEIINAVNYNILDFQEKFVLNIQDFNAAKVPTMSEAFEFYFVDKINYEVESKENDITKLSFSVKYNEAGLIVRNYFYGLNLPDTKRLKTLKEKCDAILKNTTELSNYEKIIYFHDYIVKNTDYNGFGSITTAYDALIDKNASSDGYAEAYQLLLTLSGIENRTVYSISDNGVQPHYFNKVLLDGKWFNVDVSVDDPPGIGYSNDRVLHTFLLVTDNVSRQRYQWETKRYPKSTTKNNWHMRNNLTAKNQDDLEELVNNAIESKQKNISIWIDNYNGKNYDISFARNHSLIKECKINYIAPGSNYSKDTLSTALYFEFIY